MPIKGFSCNPSSPSGAGAGLGLLLGAGKGKTIPRSPNASWPCEMPPHREPHSSALPAAPQRPHTFRAAVPMLGLELRLLGRLVGVSLGGDSVTSGNGSDGKTPAAKTAGYKRLGGRERAGRQRGQKNRLDGAVGTRRGRREPRDRGGGRSGVSRAASPQPHAHGIASSAPQREESPEDA